MTETSITLSTVREGADDLIALSNGNFIARYGHILQAYTSAGLATGTPISLVTGSNVLGRFSVAALDNGGFVATWYLFGPASSIVRAQVYNSGGATVGPTLDMSGVVNVTTAFYQDPIAVGLSNGTSLVIWDDFASGTGTGSLRGRIVSNTGTLPNPSFVIESSTTYTPALPSVTKLSGGDLFVTWTDNDDLANAVPSNIWARHLDANGQPTGTSFVVNSATAAVRLNSEVTTIGTNTIVVTWSESADELGSPVVFHGQVINASTGSKIGAEFNFGTFPDGFVGNLDVAALQDGFFMAVWEQSSDVFTDEGGALLLTAIKGQIFDASGNAVGAEIAVATGTDTSDLPNGSYQRLSVPQIVRLGNGTVLVSWGDKRDNNTSDNNDTPIDSNPGKIYNLATPTVTAEAASEVTGTSIALTALFTLSDANDPDGIVSFSVRDITANGGYLTNGVDVVTEAIDVPIRDIDLWTFVTGAAGDSDTLEFTVTDADGLYNPVPALATITTLSPPTATATANGLDLSAVTATSTPLTELFAWDDADDDIVSFSVSIRDLNPNRGYFTQGGVAVTDPLLVNIPIEDINQWAFVSGVLGSADQLDFTVTDAAGLFNSEPATATITTISSAPTAVGTNLSSDAGTSTPLADLFEWDDVDGTNDILSFSVRDQGIGGGYLTQNGVRLADNQLFAIGDINEWAFVTGILGSQDTLQFSVTDAASNTVAAQSTVTTLIPGETWNDTGDENTHTGTASADLLNGLGGNDIIVGNGGSDVIYGGEGDDVITGVDPGQTQPGLGEIDIMIGGAGSDVFVLGDLNWQGYDDQDTGTVGINDYALITDFTRGEDIIQLQGNANQYLQQVDGNQIYIFINKPVGQADELVAVVQNQGVQGALNALSFSFFTGDADTDTDGDGVFDYQDNAILEINTNQRDTDNDGYGNLVDGDFDQDLRTTVFDLGIFAGRYGTTDADANLDGLGGVGVLDLGIFAGLYGKPPGLSYIDFTVPQTTTPIVLDLPFPAVDLVGVPPELPLI